MVKDKEKEILSKFDAEGFRLETMIRGVNYQTDKDKEELLAKGFVQISEADWNYYVGNMGTGVNGRGYIRDSETGKPVDAPAYLPTTQELADKLYAECQRDLQEIDAQIVNAMVLEDDELIADLKHERADRIEQYQHDLDELEGGGE